MAVPVTADDVLALVRKSGLVPGDSLDTFLQSLVDAGGLPDDPRRFIGLMIRERLLTFFQAEQLLLGKFRGFSVGKYRILERIGVGGMGQVFLCQHHQMRRRVAVKVLPPMKAQDPSALGRFYREGRASASLDHPNIVRAHDIDQDGNLHFLVMEYVDGSSLLDVVKRTGPLDPPRAANYIAQAAAGLQHAFEQGIVHRDMKPGNLMVDRAGLVKVLDMGLARFYRDTADQLTQKYDEKSVLGTADYVAPEQTTDSHAADVRADIYGLGGTLYYLLAGHAPFPDGTIAQKLMFHQTKMPRPIREVRPDVPPELAAIVERMLAKKPAARYQTPAEVIAALAPWSDQPVDAPTEAEMPQLSPLASTDASGPLPALDQPKVPVRDSGLVRPDVMPSRSSIARRPNVPTLTDYNVTPLPGHVARTMAAVAVAAPTWAAETNRLDAVSEDTPAPRPMPVPRVPRVMELPAMFQEPQPTGGGYLLLGLVAALGGSMGWLLYLNVRM